MDVAKGEAADAASGGVTAPTPTPLETAEVAAANLSDAQQVWDSAPQTTAPFAEGDTTKPEGYPAAAGIVASLIYVFVVAGIAISMGRSDSFVHAQDQNDISCGIFRCQNTGRRPLEYQGCEPRDSLASVIQVFSVFGSVFAFAYAFMYLLLGCEKTTKDVLPYLARAHIVSLACWTITLGAMGAWYNRTYCNYSMQDDYRLRYAIAFPALGIFADLAHIIALCACCNAYHTAFQGTWDKVYNA